MSRAPSITGNWQKFVACFDVHGDKQDKKAVASFFDFVDRFNPEIKVLGGDLWDFRPLRKKADAHEKKESMKKDYEAGHDFLVQYRPQYFLRGNHDERMWDLAQYGDGLLQDYATNGIEEIEVDCEIMGCRLLPYHKRNGVLKLGHLKVIHGFYTGPNAARRTALLYGSTIFGHGHGIQHSQVEDLDFCMGRMCGCLTELDHDYNRAHPGTLAQAHGWAYGVIHKRTGAFHVAQAQQVGGCWSYELLNL